jgi:hypothetical protein
MHLTIWPYIARTVDRILASMDGLTPEELNWKPAPDASSLYILGAHIIGSVNERLLGAMCGQEVQRDREAEFVARGDSAESLLRQWLAQRQQIEEGLAALPANAVEQHYTHTWRGELTGLELLLVVARHAAEHQGHADLTRQLILAQRT